MNGLTGVRIVPWIVDHNVVLHWPAIDLENLKGEALSSLPKAALQWGYASPTRRRSSHSTMSGGGWNSRSPVESIFPIWAHMETKVGQVVHFIFRCSHHHTCDISSISGSPLSLVSNLANFWLPTRGSNILTMLTVVDEITMHNNSYQSLLSSLVSSFITSPKLEMQLLSAHWLTFSSSCCSE